MVPGRHMPAAAVGKVGETQKLTAQYGGYNLFSPTSKGRCTLGLPDDVNKRKTAIFPYSVAK